MIFANLLNLGVLAAAGLLAWWLSGFDSRLSGDNARSDFIRRAVRCGITLALVELAFWSLWMYWRYGDRMCGFIYLVTVLPLPFLWAGCLAEMFAHGFQWMLDPADHRESDPDKHLRDLDAIALLIKNGHKETAIELCRQLKESGDANVLAMETLLAHLGVEQISVKKSKPIVEAGRLRQQGRFTEAELVLQSLLKKNPANVDAAILLTRLYAQDLHDVEKASAVLASLEREPHVSSGHIEFARRSIHEWSRPQPPPEEIPAPPESVDDLLALKYFGTAIEVLEQKIKEQPQDFDLWMKLAEAHGWHCGDIKRAEKIVEQMENSFAFDAGQIQAATRQIGRMARGQKINHASLRIRAMRRRLQGLRREIYLEPSALGQAAHELSRVPQAGA